MMVKTNEELETEINFLKADIADLRDHIRKLYQILYREGFKTEI